MKKNLSYIVYSFVVFLFIFSSCKNTQKVNISESGSAVTLENEQIAFVFDCSRGTYSITDKSAGHPSVSDAKVKINDWSSADEGFKRLWQQRKVKDSFGEGLALDLTLAKEGGPKLLFSFILYNDFGFINAKGGIVNSTEDTIQVKEIYVVSDARIYSCVDVSENFAMVDGFSAGEPLEYGDRLYSPLTRSNALKSRNNILLTFTKDANRQTMVLGGLTYNDFDKFAHITQLRKTELERGADGEKSLLCYLNLPTDKSDQHEGGEHLKMIKGEDLQTWQYHEFRCEEIATSVKSLGEIVFEAKNIDPAKPYMLGFSWWNGYRHGNHDDNYQSVFAEYKVDGTVKRIPLIENQLLPRFDGREKKDVEQVEFLLPTEVTKAGSFNIVVTKGKGEEKDKNVYLSELWLRDGTMKPLLPNVLTPVKDCPRPRIAYTAQLFAKDPVGRRVDPGKEYRPFDSFYIDIVNSDPFIALETYGKRVSTAQGIDLSMYDFPSVCLWYAENSHYGSSSAENTTLGAVNEMKLIKESGFLNYSRAAVRLVPDSYQPDNQQGWWDDEHWQKEVEKHNGSKNGRYVEPYETSEKWGKAVTDLGGIPLTYFQASYRSEDYAKAFPGHMLFNKTYAWKGKEVDTKSEMFTTWNTAWTRNGSVVWAYDYTDPEFLDHLTKVYQNLKKANIQGLMFDYPCEARAEKGGMEDKYSTTAAAYRNIFKYANEGLGPNAYVHERNMVKGSDVTIGQVASMRTENDTDQMDSTTVTRCGLRWYKNRVLINQDTDSKNIVRLQHDRDKVRSVLTMAYVVTGRLLLANSFSQFTPETLWDITRTFPYHTENQSARPVDAFVAPSPTVYDYEIDSLWHQVTFYNPSMDRSRQIGINIAGQPVDGALGLDKDKSYYVYDFWNDHFVGKLKGDMRIEQELRAGEARMMSVKESLDRPQILSTNRHLMQGYLDVVSSSWNPETKTLSGVSKVVGNDPYIVILAANGLDKLDCSSKDATTNLALSEDPNGLLRLTLLRPENGEVSWSVTFNYKKNE